MPTFYLHCNNGCTELTLLMMVMVLVWISLMSLKLSLMIPLVQKWLLRQLWLLFFHLSFVMPTRLLLLHPTPTPQTPSVSDGTCSRLLLFPSLLVITNAGRSDCYSLLYGLWSTSVGFWAWHNRIYRLHSMTFRHRLELVPSMPPLPTRRSPHPVCTKI